MILKFISKSEQVRVAEFLKEKKAIRKDLAY